jgi:adsorption protein B
VTSLDHFVLSILTPLAAAILLSGLDDLLVDAVWAWAWIKSKLRPAASLFPPGPRQLEAAPLSPIAIFVPLWHEDAVIAEMLEHNLASIRYPNYHIFAGCYPNDPATQAAVRSVADRYPNVHLAVCPHDGPTSKADCLNWVYQHMLLLEEQSGTRFEIVVTHDAEDLVHPEELRWINYYAARYDFVQTPVLPLVTPLGEITHGVYIDEFAEYHSRDMTVRAALGGFVPSCGVGTGYRRDALERLAETSANHVFEPEALTEDYDNGLRLKRLGCTQAFVPIAPHGASDFVATREYFPRHFRAALRQRVRWVMGISLQSWQKFGWNGTLSEIYWLWRDRKGLLANPLSMLANAVFVYGLMSQVWLRTSVLAMQLAEVTFALLCLRTAVRMGCVARIYGFRMALGVPVRAVYANVLNSAATVEAVRRFAIARLYGRPLKWLKTEHAYPTRAALNAIAEGQREVPLTRHAGAGNP